VSDLEKRLRAGLRTAAEEGPDFVAPDLVAESAEAPHRLRRWPLAVAAASVLVAGGVGFAVLREPGSTGSADCAFVVEWDGQTWVDHGAIDRVPVAGDVLGHGVVPGCDDMGQGPGPSEDVVVRSVRGVDASEAILVNGNVLLPDGVTALPEQLRAGRGPVRCDLGGTVRLTGRWVGVTSRRESRFDGDVRPPYRVEFRTTDPRVTDGWAEVGLRALGTTGSRPLTPTEVKAMLWHEDEEVLTTHCEDGRFVVDSIDPVG
jgi:hypothetical protein